MAPKFDCVFLECSSGMLRARIIPKIHERYSVDFVRKILQEENVIELPANDAYYLATFASRNMKIRYPL